MELGEDFSDATALMNAEVYELVKNVSSGDDSQQQIVHKTLEYVERFRKYTNINSVTTIREMLEDRGMRQYEVAALANLCLSTTDEAKTLIPTLNSRFEDEDDASLQQILEQIQNARDME